MPDEKSAPAAETAPKRARKPRAKKVPAPPTATAADAPTAVEPAAATAPGAPEALAPSAGRCLDGSDEGRPLAPVTEE